ncbi:MAG: sugar transferase [Gammaproteobacteria bacterium]|nr:sugar transferase [Gammaproteobacteria bacterium]
MYCQCLKRVFDFIMASLLIVLLAPILLFIYLLVRFSFGSPVLFTQVRPGWREAPFRLYKFRTMRDVRDERGELLSDEKRLTRIGRLLRSLSVDELPSLINILKGEMSFIGPRPLLMAYLPYYSETQKKRHAVRPGLTGWAQVNGRNLLSWDQKFSYDVWYVEHCSFLLDCKIILLTLVKILKREGINAAGQATMTRFDFEVQQQRKQSA